MKHAVLVILALAACGKSGEQQAREDIERELAKQAADKKATEPAAGDASGSGSAPAAKADTPPPAPEPEPTTAAEIDAARKKAMIAGRDKDVVRYCEMTKLDDKTDPQILLGCTLAACRLENADKARAWSSPLQKPAGKPYLEQAKKVCITFKVGL